MDGGERRLTAQYLVDATGRASLIGRRFGPLRMNLESVLRLVLDI